MFRAVLRSASGAAKRAAGSGGAAWAAGRQTFATFAKSQATGSEFSAAVAAAAFAVTSTSSIAFASTRERSFIMVKPDGVNRGLVGDIIQRFERKGYKICGIKVLVPSREIASLHYAEHDGKPFFPKLVDFLSSGPVVALVFEGDGVVTYGRTLIGATNPLASAPGTIRGDFGVATSRNIVHGSDSVQSAQREIALWFKPEELASYSKVIEAWLYEE